MNQQSLSSEKAKHIESFVNDNLRRDLQGYDNFLIKTNGEIMEFVQLKNTVQHIRDHMSDGFKTQMDIGANFFMQAKVNDPNTIKVNIGLNHYVDFTLDEAIKFCDFKVKMLQNEADVIREKSIETRAKIKLALLCLNENYSQEV